MPRLLSNLATGLRRLAKPLLVALCAGLPACDKPTSGGPQSAELKPAAAPLPNPGLANARFELARQAARQSDHPTALAWAVAALEIDPSHAPGISLIHRLFTDSDWYLTTSTHQTRLQAPYLAQHENFLWIALEGTEDSKPNKRLFQTVVRFDLATSTVAATLFPALNARTSHLALSPNGKFLIVSRVDPTGTTNLLCHADSLSPIIPLGRFPEYAPIDSLTAFSTNDLLFAHPEQTSPTAPTRWHIRDSASGEILRTETVAEPVLAARFNSEQQRLELFHPIGKITSIPLSPAQRIETLPHEAFQWYEQMLIERHSRGFIALRKNAPFDVTRGEFRLSQDATGFSAIDRAPVDRKRLLLQLPYSERSQFWSRFRHLTSPIAPPPSKFGIVAESLSSSHRIASDRQGRIDIQSRLPRPLAYRRADEDSPYIARPIFPEGYPVSTLPPETLRSLRSLASLLSGKSLNPETAEFSNVDSHEFSTEPWPDARSLDAVGLKFDDLLTELKSHAQSSGTRANFTPLWKRLAVADGSGNLWPHILEWSDGLGFERWHQDLAEAIQFQSGTAKPPSEPSNDPSPWRALTHLKQSFESNDRSQIESRLAALDGNPIPASAALAHAMQEREPTWISTILERCPELPPTLKMAATVRLLWCQDRKRDAIALWPKTPPDVPSLLRHEDWLGWELTDFSPAFESIEADITKELEGLILPPDATPELRSAVAQRLLDPMTETIVGKPRLADFCVKAASHFAELPDESETTFKLAQLARRLGAPAEPCLRAEALSLTSMGNFTEAHPRWIILLTQHPVETHLPSDYSEAAYTAFETGDSNQAMEILATGVNRFPTDAAFALRAGWIALLTANGDRAYDFLIAAQDIGIPDDQLERANALLAIAAYQAEFVEEAFIHHAKLLEINESWADEEFIDALEWPGELTATLHQLAWQP